jgi:hypothetical protein
MSHTLLLMVFAIAIVYAIVRSFELEVRIRRLERRKD